MASGTGKASKERAKKEMAKRHMKAKDVATLVFLTKGAIRRLARRGGVKRISGNAYGPVKEFAESYTKEILHDALTLSAYMGHSTVTAMDVVHALKRHGQTIYGYN